jgi:hypothetical protein
VGERRYPSEPAEAALALFQRWLGAHYARSISASGIEEAGGGSWTATVTIARRWPLPVTVLDTLSGGVTVAFEAARAAVEQRLDADGQSVVLWLPRGARLPDGEPGLSELVALASEAVPASEGRHELRWPVRLQLRRTSPTGSVITALGGMSAHWAQFTNRVPGSFQLNSQALHRLPWDPAERETIADRIVLAAQQPDVDEGLPVPADDAWTVTRLDEGRSYVVGTPAPEGDEQSATLRRTLRSLLKAAPPAKEHSALVVIGASTYAEEEKLSWALRGMDPALYAGHALVCVVTDGVVKPLLEPQRGQLPWDAPAG